MMPLDEMPLDEIGAHLVTVQCPDCAWAAQMTATDLREIARFLGARFAEHVSAAHPDRIRVQLQPATRPAS